MPGGPHHMGAQNSAIGECLLNHIVGRVLHSQTKRPLRSRVILCLDSAQPPHYIVGFLKRLLGDELVMKSLLRNVQVCHYSSSYSRRLSRIMKFHEQDRQEVVILSPFASLSVNSAKDLTHRAP